MTSQTIVQGNEPEADPGADQKRDALAETDNLDLVGILSSIEETAYAWDLGSGRIEWGSNAAAILFAITEDTPSPLALIILKHLQNYIVHYEAREPSAFLPGGIARRVKHAP